MNRARTHCAGCGQPAERCDGGCRSHPHAPRFCDRCGRRLTVYVTPGHFSARCRDHGSIDDAKGAATT